MLKNITINGKKIEYRKWKVKDKIKLDKCSKIIDKRKVVVYDCLTNKVNLDADEYNYVLSLIRDFSLHSDITFTIECPECGNVETITLPVSEIVSFREADYSPIVTDKLIIVLDDVKDNYEEIISSVNNKLEKYITDFMLHIKTVNGNTLTLEELNTFINDMDVDVFEKILFEWDKKKSKYSCVKDIQCSECKTLFACDLQNMNDFFPKSWKI